MRGRLSRNLGYLLQRHVLRRPIMLADGLPLGMRFRFRSADDVGRRLFKQRVHEPHVLRRLLDQQPLWHGGLAIDAGANLGWYSVLFERLDLSRVLAFEPDPGNLELLRDNVALNEARAVEVVAAALSDHAGEATLHRYPGINLGRHALRPGDRSRTGVTVSLITLDEALAQRGVGERQVTVLKADVEGHEPELVSGAARALLRTQILILEYSPMYYTASAAAGMLQRLVGSGLQPEAWLSGEWRPVGVDELLGLEEQCDTFWSRD